MKIISLKYTRCYLLPSGSKYILIDTGYEYEWDRFTKQLNDFNIPPSSISHLILTHHHDDHAGLVARLVEENPEIVVVVSKVGAQYLLQGKHVQPEGSGYINRRVAFLLWFKSKFDKGWTHTFPAYQHRPADVLIDGTVKFKDIGIDLDGVIVETPGHSDDSISLVLDDGRCFCGDAAANFLRFAGTRYAVIWVDRWDEYYNSWEKLIALKVNRIYPAHGKDFHVKKLVANLRKNRKKNMVVVTQG